MNDRISPGSAEEQAALCGMSAPDATRSAEVGTELLLQRTSSWNDEPYDGYPSGQPLLTTVKMTIPANSALHWHTHPMPNTAYVLSGSLTVEEHGTGRTAVYQTGEAFAESVGSVHRGLTGSDPAVVIVTYAGSVGQPLSVSFESAAE